MITIGKKIKKLRLEKEYSQESIYRKNPSQISLIESGKIKNPAEFIIREIAKNLEKEALSDPYFVERNLYPNVDFYSGIIYRAMGIPTNMFTVMFALGRLPGWLAHWNEMIHSKDFRINRPRQIYKGSTKR